MSNRARLEQALISPNVQAFLGMIRVGEGTSGPNGYRTLFGGELFDDFTDHPRRAITRMLGGKPLTSTAAGAYQFLSKTWAGLKGLWGFEDFGPHNQDLGAVALIEGRKALSDVLEGRFDVAVLKCSLEWASLPGSPYGQPVMKLEQARAEYLKRGGSLASNPAKAAPPLSTPSEAPMPFPIIPAIATAILPKLLEAAPDLLKIYNDKDKSSREKNQEFAMKALEVAQVATGANSAEEVVKAIDTPEGRAAYQDAVRMNWFELQQASEKSVQAARDFNMAWNQIKDVRTIVFNLTFVELLSLLMLVIGSIGGFVVLLSGKDAFSMELKGAVVTLMLIGLVTGVKEFWLGSSYGSREKDMTTKKTVE